MGNRYQRRTGKSKGRFEMVAGRGSWRCGCRSARCRRQHVHQRLGDPQREQCNFGYHAAGDQRHPGQPKRFECGDQLGNK